MKKFLILIFLLIFSNAGAQKWQREMDSVLNLLAEKGLFDGQVFLAKKGQVHLNAAYGEMEDQPERPKIMTTDAFQVHSVGKSMTAAGILLLVERGQLQLKDKLVKFFPETPYKNVTLEQLMSMTSGLPRFLPTALENGDTTKIMNSRELIELVWKKAPEAGIPGENFFYNNANYYLLARIIEKQTKQDFGAFLRENIFEPLEMRNTYEGTSKDILALDGKKINADNFLQASGAGSVYTTAEDLYKYDRALKNNIFLPKQLKEKAFSEFRLNNGDLSNYGYGWRISRDSVGKEVYHVGDGLEMRAVLQRFIDEDRTLILLHAFSNEYSEAVYWVIRNIWEGKAYELPQKREKYVVAPDLLEKYVGAYEGPNFGKIHISLNNGKLYLRPDPIPGKEELVPLSDTIFYFEGQNLEWQFYFDEQGEVQAFGIKGSKEMKGFPIKKDPGSGN